MEYAGRLLVEDSSGARFQLYEYRARRLFKSVRQFVLETGERVTRIDFNNYRMPTTGERLCRVEAEVRAVRHSDVASHSAARFVESSAI